MRKRRGLLVGGILVLAFLSGCGSLRFGSQKDLRRRGVYHVIKPGETLYRIARTYGVEVQDLAKANHIADPRKIRKGTRLFIPGARRVRKVPSRKARVTKAPGESPRGVIPDAEASVIIPGELDFDWPLRGSLTSPFGRRGHQMHQGVDIAAVTGTPIRAAEEGTVIFSDRGPGGYGLMVILRHASGFHSVYAHNRKNLVKVGQQVRQGEAIALVGNTGRSTGPHLHFEIRNRTSPQDPLFFLP